MSIKETEESWMNLDNHPLPKQNCNIDIKLKCGSQLFNCDNFLLSTTTIGVTTIGVYFHGYRMAKSEITQWRYSK
jgi:hypothetical protein